MDGSTLLVEGKTKLHRAFHRYRNPETRLLMGGDVGRKGDVAGDDVENIGDIWIAHFLLLHGTPTAYLYIS